MSLVFPREHGAWGILLVPFLTAAAIAGVFGLPVALALLTVLLVFLARTPLEIWLLSGTDRRQPVLTLRQARRWAALYGAGAVAVGAALVLLWQRLELLAVGLLAAALFAWHVRAIRRQGARSWTGELLGTVALTLSAPAAWIAATGGFDSTGLLVWLLNVAFFSAGLVYVKSRIRAVGAECRAGEVTESARLVLGYHLAVVLFVAGLVLGRWVSPLVLLPFLLATARAGWGAREFGQRFAVRQLGWSEVGHSLVFALLLVAAFRL